MRLENKVALISGGARGMGEVEAKLFAKEGAKVIIGDMLEDKGRKVEAQINEAGGECVFVVLDVSDEDAWQRAVNEAVSRFGKLDILVNNAAANPYFGPIEDTDLNAFQKTVDVNIRGYFFMCANGARMMKDNGGGAIVNVASVNGVNPGHFQGIYSVTKAAVISMTKSFAMELGQRNVRVNALLPGLTDTRFASALTSNEAIKKQAMAHIPMKRVADPDEMAGTVLYLVSGASSYTTGACINADGGYLTV